MERLPRCTACVCCLDEPYDLAGAGQSEIGRPILAVGSDLQILEVERDVVVDRLCGIADAVLSCLASFVCSWYNLINGRAAPTCHRSSIDAMLMFVSERRYDSGVTTMAGTRAVLLSLLLEADDDGYLASVPGLQGAFAEGESVEEAVFNCADVVNLIAAYRLERGETLGLGEVELTPDTRIAVAIPVAVG